MSSFKDKVVIVTGSSSGIGAGTAVHFAGQGAKVVLMGRNEGKLKGVAERCKEAGGADDKVVVLIGDIRDKDFRKKLIDDTIKTFGKLDILVNNAASCIRGGLGHVLEENLEHVIDVNLKSVILLTSLALPHLLKTKGSVVNISTLNSTIPTADNGAYCVSKAGLDMATKCLALEFASKGVRVNAVNPGIIDESDILLNHGFTPEENEEFWTNEIPKNPVRRNGKAVDIARAIAFLADDNNSFITGETLAVDGGRTSAYKPIGKDTY